MKHYLVYSNDTYGHMLAAIAERWIKRNPEDTIVYWPNIGVSFTTHLSMPRDISKKDTVWILGQSPTQRGMVDLKSETRPKKIYWYDYHTALIEYILSDKESFGMDKYAGARTDTDKLGIQMWKDLFPNEKVPPVVYWVTDFMSGNDSSANAYAFYYGLQLIETCPKALSLYPPVEEGDNNPANVWDACLSTYDVLGDDEGEEETVSRMQWDATYQIINMGSILRTYRQLITQQLIDAEKFKTHFLEGGERILLVNATDLDIPTIRDYYITTGSAFSHVGFYNFSGEDAPYFDITLIRLPSGISSYEVASKYINARGNDEVAYFRTLGLVYDHISISDVVGRKLKAQKEGTNNDDNSSSDDSDNS